MNFLTKPIADLPAPKTFGAKQTFSESDLAAADAAIANDAISNGVQYPDKSTARNYARTLQTKLIARNNKRVIRILVVGTDSLVDGKQTEVAPFLWWLIQTPGETVIKPPKPRDKKTTTKK